MGKRASQNLAYKLQDEKRENFLTHNVLVAVMVRNAIWSRLRNGSPAGSWEQGMDGCLPQKAMAY